MDTPRLTFSAASAGRLANAAAATAVARFFGVSDDTIAAALLSYPGLPHRQQQIVTIDGVTFVNDSKATNADAAERALVCYDRLIWIAGGMAKEGGMATLRLPSGEMRLVRAECRATVGTIGNADHQNVKIGKAGRKRHMGVRPQTRGTAMNPVDHPHGGGEGSTTPGRHPVTPWGVPTLGYRTRRKNKSSDRYIVRGRRRGKGKR